MVDLRWDINHELSYFGPNENVIVTKLNKYNFKLLFLV